MCLQSSLLSLCRSWRYFTAAAYFSTLSFVKVMKKTAIISVYDKTGLEPFARALADSGIEILSTGGTARFLTERGITNTSISEYTGHPEIFDGRVKSLHPRIHGGILARRDNPTDMAQFEELGISPIDFVVVNLYPFTHRVRDLLSSGHISHGSLVELIDIGGPTMLRASAKNCHAVVPVCDPADYNLLLEELKENGDVSLSMRRKLAAKVFSTMAAYDASVSRYFSLNESLFDSEGNAALFAPFEGIALRKKMALRYGENPHQRAAFYEDVKVEGGSEEALWTQVQGKELSYNNILDMNGALELFLDLRSAFSRNEVAVVIKHSNPCGAALGENTLQAFDAARSCDPVSAFGGIIAVSGTLDAPLAASMLEGFLEVVLVEKVTDEALALFAKKRNIRLLVCDFDALNRRRKISHVGLRSMIDGYLLQTRDSEIVEVTEEQVVTGEIKSKEQLRDLHFAWIVSAHTKSNAIVIARDGKAIGVGAGQMSRVDSSRIAIERARIHGHDLAGSVAASDAFLPFPDTVETLGDAGVVSLVQPGGSIKDELVIEVARNRSMSMLFTGERHFRH